MLGRWSCFLGSLSLVVAVGCGGGGSSHGVAVNPAASNSAPGSSSSSVITPGGTTTSPGNTTGSNPGTTPGTTATTPTTQPVGPATGHVYFSANDQVYSYDIANTTLTAIAGAHGSVVRAASDDGRYLLCQRVVSTFSYVIDTQTNNRQFLYQARAHSMAVDISNNGRYVVLLEKIVPGDYRWTLYDMNTGRLVPLPNAKRSTTRAAASATVSDDGNTVAYTMYDHNVIKLVVYVYDRTTDSHIFRAGSNALISTRRPQLPPSLRMSGDGNEISYVTRSGNLLLRDLTKVNGIRYKPAGGKVVMTADSFTPQSPWLLTLNRVGAYDGNGNFDGFLTLFDRRSGQEKVLPNLATAVIEGNDYAKLELSADGRIIVGAGWRVASSQQPELDAIKIYDVETGMFYPVEVSRGVPALCDFGSRVLVRP